MTRKRRKPGDKPGDEPGPWSRAPWSRAQLGKLEDGDALNYLHAFRPEIGHSQALRLLREAKAARRQAQAPRLVQEDDGFFQLHAGAGDLDLRQFIDLDAPAERRGPPRGWASDKPFRQAFAEAWRAEEKKAHGKPTQDAVARVMGYTDRSGLIRALKTEGMAFEAPSLDDD